jgi:hypothetical protein
MITLDEEKSTTASVKVSHAKKSRASGLGPYEGVAFQAVNKKPTIGE